MNLVMLVGRLTKDPELKYSQSGKAFSKFSLAVTREFKRDEADFINCVAWDKRAETIAEYLRKGREIAIQGRLSVRSYDQDGEKKWITEVIVDKFDFIGGSGNNDNTNNYSKSDNAVSQDDSSNADFADDEDDDFPF